MFVLGLIVGIILAIVLYLTVVYPWALREIGVTHEEHVAAINLMSAAANDRESSLILVKDDEAIDEVVFYE